MKPTVVTLAGLPGVGKTAAALAVLRHRPAGAVLASEHSTLAHDVIAHSRGLASRSRLSPALAYVLAEYALALDQAEAPTTILMRDRGLEDTLYVVETLVEQGELPASVLDQLRHPRLLSADLLVLLTADENTRAQRLSARGRDQEAAAESRRWERDFMGNYHDWLRSRPLALFEIDTSDMSREEVSAEIVARLAATVSIS